MKYSIQGVTPAEPREEFVKFLAHFEGEDRGEEYWRKRLAFWWDTNPCKPAEFPCGWVARCDGKVVGFLAALWFEYTYRGQTYPALNAGTWRVDKEHRNASLPMFVQWQRFRDKFILIDTTPNAEVSKILDRFGYTAARKVDHHFFPLQHGGGLMAPAFRALHWLARLTLPKAPARIVSLKDKFVVRHECVNPDRIEKRITREYLEWYCSWPEKAFIGSVDADNVLTSYLILEPSAYGKFHPISVIDYFSTRADNYEILGLVRCVLQDPTRLGLGREFDFVMLNTLEEGKFGKRLGSIYRTNPAKHYYSLPPTLKEVPKRCVIAEGDYGC